MWNAVLLSGILILLDCALILNGSNNRKYVLGEDWLCSSKKMAPVVGNKAVPFLRKSATDGLWENATDFAENQQPALGKSATDFGKISRLWENRPPTLGKPATDFGKIGPRLRENRQPTLGKSATDFGKICHRLWEARFFEKKQSPFLGKHLA